MATASSGFSSDFSGLGTRLRHLLELLEDDIASVYPALGLVDFRPRYTPVVRALTALGPSPIRDLARALGVTHSAASQTVAQMRRRGLVALRPGRDARQRVVSLTPEGRALVPVLAAEWAAVEAAVADLDAELPCPLGEMVTQTMRALERRPFRERVAEAARAQGSAAPRRSGTRCADRDGSRAAPEPR